MASRGDCDSAVRAQDIEEGEQQAKEERLPAPPGALPPMVVASLAAMPDFGALGPARADADDIVIDVTQQQQQQQQKKRRLDTAVAVVSDDGGGAADAVAWRWAQVLIDDVFRTERGIATLAHLMTHRSTVDVRRRRFDAGRNTAGAQPFSGPAVLTEMLVGVVRNLWLLPMRLRVTQSGVRFYDADEYTVPTASLGDACCRAIESAAQHNGQLFRRVSMMNSFIGDDSFVVSHFVLDHWLCDVARGGIDRCAVARAVYTRIAAAAIGAPRTAPVWQQQAAAAAASADCVACVVAALNTVIYETSAAVAAAAAGAGSASANAARSNRLLEAAVGSMAATHQHILDMWAAATTATTTTTVVAVAAVAGTEPDARH